MNLSKRDQEAAQKPYVRCRECAHFIPKCQWLILRTGNEKECDWFPSRFIPVKTTGSLEGGR